jgi:hypothetical protein
MISEKKEDTLKAPQEWYLVTNHLNLLYMLAAGLVMEPSGFGEKYYADSLEDAPGEIPLFGNAIPRKALEQAVSERRHLRPCIVSLDLSGISGEVRVWSQERKARKAAFPRTRLGKNDMGILIRAPLPITLVSKVFFQSENDQQAFETAASDVSNVDLAPYRLEIKKSLFCNAPDNTQAQNEFFFERYRTPINQTNHLHTFSQALGGLLTMLYHGANRSELGIDVFHRITNSAHNANEPSIQDRILAELPNWLNGDDISGISDVPARLYWGVVNALIGMQGSKSTLQPVEVVLQYLDEQMKALTDEKYKSRLERLILDMRSCLGLGSGTITEIFERNKGSLSRPLLLFCLRKRCLELLEFSHPLLSDAEYLLAGILFGIRDGWLGLPSKVRSRALLPYVAYRMAIATHQKRNDGLALPEKPAPQPLRALFPVEKGAWDIIQISAAIEIAQCNNWQDCFETPAKLLESSAPDKQQREHENFSFSEDLTLMQKIRHERFLQRLGEWPPIDEALDARIRDIIKKKRMAQK